MNIEEVSSISLLDFGYIMYVKIINESLKKLDDYYKPMVFIGYKRSSKGYRAYDPTDRRICLIRNIIFNKERS